MRRGATSAQLSPPAFVYPGASTYTVSLAYTDNVSLRGADGITTGCVGTSRGITVIGSMRMIVLHVHGPSRGQRCIRVVIHAARVLQIFVFG